MNVPPSVRARLRSCGPWLAVVLIPPVVNLAAWRLLVAPQQAGLRAWRNASALAELQPQLAALLSQTHQALAEWQRTSFAGDDPSAVTQTVQQLAGRHHLDVRRLNVSDAAAEAGSTRTVELEATGRFNHLARWMSDVERQSGLQVDAWDLTPATEADPSCRLTVKMTALLAAAPRPAVGGAPADDEQAFQRLSSALASAQSLARQIAPYDAVFRRNPMKPLINAQGRLTASSGMSGGLSVQGIIWSEERPLAVVDDELFAQGDVVGPYTILRIMSDRVIAQRGAEHLTIPLDRGIDPPQ